MRSAETRTVQVIVRSLLASLPVRHLTGRRQVGLDVLTCPRRGERAGHAFGGQRERWAGSPVPSLPAPPVHGAGCSLALHRSRTAPHPPRLSPNAITGSRARASASRANQCESRVRGRLGVRGAPRYRFWDIHRQRRPQALAAASASMTRHPVGPCVDQNLRPEQAPCIGRWTGHGLVKRCRGTEVRLARPKVRRGMRGARAGHGDRNPNQTQTHS